MSRLTDLIARAKAKDSALGEELEREFKVLASRRAFGLNFERHRPESVELPGRPVRRGDKVRILPPRGSTRRGDQRLWKVSRIEGKGKSKVAQLALVDAEPPETTEVTIADLVVVAEFRDFIYPGLVSTGKVERGGDKPFHTVINGENFHVLEALTYTHRGKIDVIYIDPPYNTGARDWKYNNDYVESEDLYRHSKWLAFMERRLLIARELLNPDGSAIIVTIDEKEYLRLGLLLEQIFPDARIQMISSLVNPTGTQRRDSFNRIDEYIYVIRIGHAPISPETKANSIGDDLDWQTFRLRNSSLIRSSRPNQFYAIFVRESDKKIIGCSEAINQSVSRETIVAPAGCIAVFPVRPDGTEMLWAAKPTEFRSRLKDGYIRATKHTPSEPQAFIIQYLRGGTISAIKRGAISVTGRSSDGSIIGTRNIAATTMPTTQWNRPAHNAQIGGTRLLR